ncbi:hypothetical protein DMUE_0773 [Dictyocoela muelleri]|nr:hypothetical protein DMUE_0773 [Dictyocoela muelleri]
MQEDADKKNKKTENLGIIWFCSYCNKNYSKLIDSEFYNLRFDLIMILKFTFYYFQRNNFSHEYILNNCGISEEGYITLLSLFRIKIREYIENDPVRIVGPFKEIQIDEYHWAKRKYGLGRIEEAVWIFGMIEVKSNICYLQKVKFRDAVTLDPIIN